MSSYDVGGGHGGAPGYAGGSRNDQRYNWILLNKHESLPEQQSAKRIIYHKPLVVPAPSAEQATFVHRPTREALHRISSINRLNDRIRRRLEAGEVYASTSAFDEFGKTRHPSTIREETDDLLTVASEASRRRADRLVDEHFGFIREESDESGVQPCIVSEESTFVQQEHNARGPVDGVFERRAVGDRKSSFLRLGRTGVSDLQQQQQQQQQQHPAPPPPHSGRLERRPTASGVAVGGAGGIVFRKRRSLTDPQLGAARFYHPHNSANAPAPAPSLSPPQQPSTSRGPVGVGGQTTQTQTGIVHNIPISLVRKRADSLDSGSLRLGSGVQRDPYPTPMTTSEWQTPAMSRRPSFRRRDSFQPVERRPTALYRHRVQPSSSRFSFSDRPREYEPRRLSRRSSRLLQKKTPSMLRRDSYYYRKCDVCLNEPLFDGNACPACNSISVRPRPQRLLKRLSHNLEQHLHRPRMHRRPSRVGSGHLRIPPPPVTIEPYLAEEEEEEDGGETSGERSDSSSEPQPSGVPGLPWATIPPRGAAQTGFYVGQQSGGGGGNREVPFPFSTSPRRPLNNRMLNAELLQHHPSYLGYSVPPMGATAYIPMRPHSPLGSRQSTVIWPANAGPAWKSIEHRPRTNPSPVFRYGKQMPKWLYDYDAYAEEQRHKESERRKRKVIAITMIFLFLALVVAAGVVLAAIN